MVAYGGPSGGGGFRRGGYSWRARRFGDRGKRGYGTEGEGRRFGDQGVRSRLGDQGWGRGFGDRRRSRGFSGPWRGGVSKYRSGTRRFTPRVDGLLPKRKVLTKDAVHLEFVTWNVTGEKSVTPEEIDGILIKKRHPDIVCLQEVKSLPSEDFKGTDNYKWFCAGPGSAILVSNKSEITGDNFQQLSPQICQVDVALKNGTKVKVISCYMPPSTEYAAEELWTKLTQSLKNIPTNMQFLLAGDFNAEISKKDRSKHRLNHTGNKILKEDGGKMAIWSCGTVLLHEDTNDNGKKIVGLVRVAHLKLSGTFRLPVVPEGSSKNVHTFYDGQTKSQRSFVMLPCYRNMYVSKNFNNWEKGFHHALHGQIVDIEKVEKVEWVPEHKVNRGEVKLPFISTWSIQGATPAKIDTVLKEQCLPPIVCVQEVFLTSEEDIQTDNYNWYASKKPWAKNVGVIVLKTLEVELLDFVIISPNLCYVDLKLRKKPMRVISLYLPAEDDPQHPEVISQVNKLVEDLPKDMLSVLGGNYATVKPSSLDLRREAFKAKKVEENAKKISAGDKSKSLKEGEKSADDKPKLINGEEAMDTEEETNKDSKEEVMDTEEETNKDSKEATEDSKKDPEDAKEALNEEHNESMSTSLGVDKNTNNSVFIEDLQRNVTQKCLLLWLDWIRESGGTSTISQITEKENKSVHFMLPLANNCKVMADVYLRWISFFENGIVTMHLIEYPSVKYSADESGNETRYVKVRGGPALLSRRLQSYQDRDSQRRIARIVYICSEEDDEDEEGPLVPTSSVTLSPEDAEKFKDTVVPMEDLERLLDDFVIFLSPTKKGNFRGNVLDILAMSFHSNNMGAIELENPDVKELEGVLRIRWNGIILAEVTGKKIPTSGYRKLQKKLFASLLNKLAQFCYTVKAKRRYANKGPVNLKEDPKVKELVTFVKKEEMPTMDDVYKHIDSFFESDTDAELVFTPDFSNEDRDAVVKYAKSKQLDYRFYFNNDKDGKREASIVTLCIKRTPQQLKDKLIKNPENVKYYLMPPCKDGDDTNFAKYMDQYEKINVEEESKLTTGGSDFWSMYERQGFPKDFLTKKDTEKNEESKTTSGPPASELLTRAIEGLTASLLKDPENDGQKKALDAAKELVEALKAGKLKETDSEFESNLDNLIKNTEESLDVKPATTTGFYTPEIKQLMKEKKKVFDQYRKTKDIKMHNRFLELKKQITVVYKKWKAETMKGGNKEATAPVKKQSEGAGRLTNNRAPPARGRGQTRVGAGGQTRVGAGGQTRVGAGGQTRVGAGGQTRVGAGGQTRVGGQMRGRGQMRAGGQTRDEAWTRDGGGWTRGGGQVRERVQGVRGGRGSQQNRGAAYQATQYPQKRQGNFDMRDTKRPKMEYDNFPKVNRPDYRQLGPMIMVYPITEDSHMEHQPLRLIQANFPTEVLQNRQRNKTAILVALPTYDGSEKQFCLSSESTQLRAAQIALSFLERASTIIKPNASYLCEGSVPNFVRYKIPCKASPRSYIILSKFDTGTLTPPKAQEILKTFNASYNEDVFFDKDGYSQNEKITVMDLAPTLDLKVRYFGDLSGLNNQYICISKKKSKQTIYDEVTRMGERHPKYVISQAQPGTISVWENDSKSLFDQPQRQSLFDQPQRNNYSQSSFNSFSAGTSFNQRNSGQNQRYSQNNIGSNQYNRSRGKKNAGFNGRQTQKQSPWLAWAGAQ